MRRTEPPAVAVRPRSGRALVRLVLGAAIVGLLFAIVFLAPTLYPAELPTRAQDGLTPALSVLIESLPFVVLGVPLYAAIAIAPDIIDNRYDTYLLPMPTRVETHIVEVESGEEIVALAGLDSSWCRVPPQ